MRNDLVPRFSTAAVELMQQELLEIDYRGLVHDDLMEHEVCVCVPHSVCVCLGGGVRQSFGWEHGNLSPGLRGGSSIHVVPWGGGVPAMLDGTS